MDTNEENIERNVRGILSLSKNLLGKSVYVRYLHATDVALKENSDGNSTTHSHNKLNASSINNILQTTGNVKNNATSKVEGLSTKSAFFVISETSLVQDVLSYVRSIYSNST